MVVLLQHNTCKQHRAAGDAHLLNTPLEDWILTAFMMLGGFFFLLILTGVNGESSSKVCRYHDVLNYLNLTQNNELFSMTRPVKNYKHPTKVILEVLLYAILDVKEIDQTFVPYVWIFVIWQNEYIYWDPDDFCGIRNISLPTEVLWKPDLTIEEMTEKDKAPPSPLLTITNNGTVVVQNDQVLVSSCRMHVYKFPFDTQSCTLSFKSVIHSVEDIQLHNKFSSSQATKWSREVMRTQYEWLFINMTVTSTATNMFGIKQDVIIYTITMKRRSILYIANFLLPILFFLCLDLASFLISDSGGEKLRLKVIVLLAVIVMQLILNAILPSSSDRIPLVAIYCIGIFSLMMLSLMETILVMYLTERDSASQDKEAGGDQSLSEGEEKKRTQYSSICDMPAEELPADLSLSQGSGSHLTEESQGFGRFTEELREVVKILTLIYNSRKEEGKPGYWAGATKKINKIFFIFYVIAASLFLFCMFFHWTHAPEL